MNKNFDDFLRSLSDDDIKSISEKFSFLQDYNIPEELSFRISNCVVGVVFELLKEYHFWLFDKESSKH